MTDAMVSLGWYRPDALRASGLEVQPELAARAIDEHLASALDLTPEVAAAGTCRVLVHNMAEAIRVNSVARGLDPRDFALVAYGGAGAAFAVSVARELSMGTVIVPPAAGVGAATGLLATHWSYDRQATLWGSIQALPADRIEEEFARLSSEAAERLALEGFDRDNTQLLLTADCRYKGQGYELRVPVPSPPVNRAWRDRLAVNFHEAHKRAYGRDFQDREVQLVNVAVTAVGRVPAPVTPSLDDQVGDIPVSHTRDCWFDGADGVHSRATRFIERERLGAGAEFTGPAIIEQRDTTTVLPPGARCRVGDLGHLIIQTRPGEDS